VVAETPLGFPYGGEPTFVRSLTDVLRLYVGRSWRGVFAGFAAERQTPIRILDAVEAAQGSIGVRGAQRVGTTQAQLRRLIENWGISRDVNRIRKKYRRSPAHFRNEDEVPDRYKIYEERLPPGY